ncbi:MAG TPA: hypothetical protein VLZ12_01715, partial [Verrucomicrobiae bacterium]|nr:hypothetical protein [Verrucomicrobiae bacterium]
GAVQVRVHQFYHDGSLVGWVIAMPGSFSIKAEAGLPYAIAFEFDQAKELKSAIIGTGDGHVLDAFVCVDGMFHPDDRSRITKANEFWDALNQGAEQLLEHHPGK